jgi:hypothetical protein
MEKIEFKKQFEEIFEILGFVTVRLDNEVSLAVRNFMFCDDNLVYLMVGNLIITCLNLKKIIKLY